MSSSQGSLDMAQDSRHRTSVQPGFTVDIIRKRDQQNGQRIRGVVQDILTNTLFHPYGIKVRLKDGQVGRVSEIIGTNISIDTE
jgi:uncharacterized repeat protein (TIGR03833 family)